MRIDITFKSTFSNNANVMDLREHFCPLAFTNISAGPGGVTLNGVYACDGKAYLAGVLLAEQFGDENIERVTVFGKCISVDRMGELADEISSALWHWSENGLGDDLAGLLSDDSQPRLAA